MQKKDRSTTIHHPNAPRNTGAHAVCQSHGVIGSGGPAQRTGGQSSQQGQQQTQQLQQRSPLRAGGYGQQIGRGCVQKNQTYTQDSLPKPGIRWAKAVSEYASPHCRHHCTTGEEAKNKTPTWQYARMRRFNRRSARSGPDTSHGAGDSNLTLQVLKSYLPHRNQSHYPPGLRRKHRLSLRRHLSRNHHRRRRCAESHALRI